MRRFFRKRLPAFLLTLVMVMTMVPAVSAKSSADLTYEVDKILIVEPEEVDKLNIIDGEDYVTLVTCTPYGINTQRLLVRGRRVDTVKGASVRISSDAVRIEPIIVAPVIAAPVLCAGMFVIIGYGRNKKSKGGEVNENTEKD